MLHRVCAFCAIVVLLAFASPARSAVPLQPTGPWTVDFAETQCTASRNYGTEQKPLYLVLKRSVLDGATQLLIIQVGSIAVATQHEVVLSGGAGTPVRVRALDYTADKFKRRVRPMTLSAAQMGWLASAPRLDVTSHMFADQHFALKQVPAIYAKLGECVANLVDYWNLSPEGGARLARRAAGNLLALFADEDYPAQALVENNTGKVAVRLLVDPSGKVADCSIRETSGSAALDIQTCAVISKRAMFTPAVGLDGKASRDGYDQNVNWRIP